MLNLSSRNNKRRKVPTTFTLKVGSKVLVSRRDKDGFSILNSELWTVTIIGEGSVQLHSDNGDHIKILR